MKISWMVLVVSLVATPSLAGMCNDPAEDAGFTAVQSAAGACIIEYARREEVSREPANDIATAALAACDGQLEAVFDYLNHCNVSVVAAYRAQLPGTARGVAVRAVIEARADRERAKGGVH
jgi:formylmethanofuran dehydrogenase subunit A